MVLIVALRIAPLLLHYNLEAALVDFIMFMIGSAF